MDILDIALASKLAKGKGGGGVGHPIILVDDIAITYPSDLGWEGEFDGYTITVSSDDAGNTPLFLYAWTNGKWNKTYEVNEDTVVCERWSKNFYRFSNEEGAFVAISQPNYIYNHIFSFTYKEIGVPEFEVKGSIINKNSRCMSDLTKEEFVNEISEHRGGYGIIGLLRYKEDDTCYPITRFTTTTSGGFKYINVYHIKDNKISYIGRVVSGIDDINDAVLEL